MDKKLIFSKDKINVYRDSLFQVWENQNATEFKNSKEYASQVLEHLSKWIKKDNYAQTRTMSKFTVDTHDPSRWQPTPPAYVEDVEPHWNKIRTLVLGSAAQFKPRKHPEFSLKKIVIFIKNSKKYMISVNGLQKPEMILKKFRLHSFGIVTPMFR